ncbi:MAG: hypothetical protein PVJ67_06675 [Candidatus Pacearchaeota archaeon]|jgi:hypothetical protein
MKRGILIIPLALIFISVISAEIVITTQPDEIYNLGDTIKTPVTVKALSDVSGSFRMNLLCSGREINFYKNGINLHYGEEEKLTPSLVLTKDIIEGIIGMCKLKASFATEEPVLTNEFKISNSLTITTKENKTEFYPGKSIFIEGDAIKENGKGVNGFLDLTVFSSNGTESNYLETITNGIFSANISLDKNAKSGDYVIKFYAYERNYLGETTNEGIYEEVISVVQIPTSLEILFETPDVEPGTSAQIKTILRDQTGEKIEATKSMIKIKDKNGFILQEKEITNDEFLEFPILYNEPPARFTIIAASGKLNNEAEFNVIGKKDLKIEIINKTLLITNIGNVPYNDTAFVKIGNQTLEINVALELDETEKYILTAPDGEYDIEVLSNDKSHIAEGVMLTGKAIEVKEASERTASIIKYSFIWFFIIGICVFVSFMVLKKGYKRSFFGYIYPKRKEKQVASPLRKKYLINSQNRAELSLSIKGEKQNTSLVCLKIKNLKEISGRKNSAQDTLQEIANLSDSMKAATYENNDNLFFILTPLKTKTFRNERTAVDLATKIKEMLAHHNKMYNQKIEFGISLNNGNIVAKEEGGVLKFMSMGTMITTAKKISTLSNEEIFLSEKIKEKNISGIKLDKKTKDGITYYTIKELRDSDKHKKFINNFLERLDK